MKTSHDKRIDFQRLGEQRVNAVLQKIRVLGHCSNRQLYEYSEPEVKAIFRAIRAELKLTEEKFGDGKKQGQFRFKGS